MKDNKEVREEIKHIKELPVIKTLDACINSMVHGTAYTDPKELQRILWKAIDKIQSHVLQQSSSPFNAVGLRWVKASERLPKIPGEYHIKFYSPRANGNRYGEVAVLGVDEKWRIYDRVADDHDDMFCDVDYWLEEYTPSPNSVEDMAKEYAECRKILAELVYLKGVKDIPSYKEDYEQRKPKAWAAAKAFLAGSLPNKEGEDVLRSSDWKWEQVLSIADKSVLIEKKTLEWCLSAVQVLKTMLSKHNLTAGVDSSEALIETLTSALNKQHSLSPQPNKESEGERKFTLEEVLELWECGYDNGWVDGTEADTHMGSHNDDNFNMLRKKQYFKEKFNIDL